MKLTKILFTRLLISTSVILLSCDEDYTKTIIPEEDKTSTITKESLKPEGEVKNTSDGYIVEGKLTMNADSLVVVFNDADLEVTFNSDGSLKSIEGESQLPPSPFFQVEELENPIKADVNFYTGKYINENFNLEIPLVEDITYFIFSFEADFEMNVIIDGERINLKPPLGGHISFVADYNDPMFFWSVGAEIKGSLAFGRSYLGQLPFVPAISVDNVVEFDAKTVKGGEFSFGRIFSVQGMLYENKILGTTIDWENIEKSKLTLGYHNGLNGKMKMGIPGFEFQIAQGSYSVVTEADNQGAVIARAFFNGVVDPNLSWWPKLIPMKPDGDLSIDGYVTNKGDFDFGMSGSFEIKTPTLKERVEGVMRSSEKISFIEGKPVIDRYYTMAGKVTKDDEIWEAKAIFTDDSTIYMATPPEGFLKGVSNNVKHQIDSAFAVHEQSLEDLRNAIEQYDELNLNIKNLKTEIPPIIDYALDIIDESVEQGIKKGRADARAHLKKHKRILCSDNIPSEVNKIVQPYKDVLIDLKNAIEGLEDNDASRKRLEDALRALIAKKSFDHTVNVKIRNDWAFTGCIVPREDSRSVRVNETVIPSNYLDILKKAADNVKHLSDANSYKIKAQRVVDELPTLEELESLKNNIEGCVSGIIDNIGDVGFFKVHETGEYTYFIMVNGQRKEVSGFNVFDKKATIEVTRSEFNPCTIN